MDLSSDCSGLRKLKFLKLNNNKLDTNEKEEISSHNKFYDIKKSKFESDLLTNKINFKRELEQNYHIDFNNLRRQSDFNQRKSQNIDQYYQISKDETTKFSNCNDSDYRDGVKKRIFFDKKKR